MANANEEVTLLLVEDDDIDAMTIERSIVKQRIRNAVVRAHDGLEALELLRAGKVQKPYNILLDLQMPRMNGFEFLDEVRKDENLTDSVVFILTTSADQKDLAAGYEHHVAGYFVKDATGPLFIDLINALDHYWKVVHLPVT
tara:strand:+ start:2891 stop:3316 length:426 start_codon:yes stop_codon:yes gene_type:complete